MNIYHSLKSNEKIFLIFGGFASQHDHFIPFFPKDCNIIIVYHYQNLDFDPIKKLLHNASHVTLIAFSMGVWAASLFLQDFSLDTFWQKIAINGTEFGIDSKYGIPPKIFKLTQKTFNLESFKVNLFGENLPLAKNFTFLQKEALQEELNFFIQNQNLFPCGSNWDKVIISEKDLIFPVNAQKLFWQTLKKHKDKLLILNAPHFPFFNYHF
ncbi:MAG: DUF452 family protein [Helicobacter sp.]|nr:DUF452 family protein [Helicobacter sp.]